MLCLPSFEASSVGALKSRTHLQAPLSREHGPCSYFMSYLQRSRHDTDDSHKLNTPEFIRTSEHKFNLDPLDPLGPSNLLVEPSPSTPLQPCSCQELRLPPFFEAHRQGWKHSTKTPGKLPEPQRDTQTNWSFKQAEKPLLNAACHQAPTDSSSIF